MNWKKHLSYFGVGILLYYTSTFFFGMMIGGAGFGILIPAFYGIGIIASKLTDKLKEFYQEEE